MAKRDEPYRYCIVESYYPDSAVGLHGPIHIRPVAGEEFPTHLHVECSKDLVNPKIHPVGTRFRIRVKLTDRQAIALDIHLQNGGVMDKAIDGGQRHSLVGEDLAPFSKWLIGGDQHRSTLVTCGDQLEQDAGFGLILGDVGDVVEDEQIVAVELGDSAFECQLATRDLQLLHEISGAGKQHAPSILDQGEPERCRQMALAAAGWAEEQDIGAFLQLGVAGRQRHHLRFRDHWHGFPQGWPTPIRTGAGRREGRDRKWRPQSRRA